MPPQPSFRQRTLDWLRSQVGTAFGPYTIKHIANVTADAAAQTATAAILVDNGGLQWIHVYLYRLGAKIHWDTIPAPPPTAQP
jgi:hypothetical protein